MSQPPVSRNVPASRAEKMSILSALLGPEALARLRGGATEAPDTSGDAPVPVDADRAAWHHNRLLQRLRDQAGAPFTVQPVDQATQRSGAPATSSRTGATRRSFDMRLAALADLATLADEHPAVVTRLIRTLAREDRVAVLKSLPGPLARIVVKRLR